MKCRRDRILQGVACALVSGGAAADGPTLAVWAIGLPHGYIVMEHQAKVIDVTNEDVARGFVRITGGSRLIVATRSQGGTVVQRDVPAGKAVVAVNYRFQLAPATMPGTYAWPLEVVARHALPEGFLASGPYPGPTMLSARAAR